MATIDDLVTQGSVMPDNLRSDTARASLEYKNQLKNAGDIYVGTGTKITNNEAGVTKEIYVTEGKNIQTALNEDIFRANGKSNVNLSSSTLGAQSQYNVLIGSGASINGSSKNVVIGRGAQISSPFDNSIAIGNNANVNASGIAIGDSTRTTGTNGVVIGDEAQNASTKGIAIGYKAKANTLNSGAIAIGDTAVSTAENAVQIGTGTNSVANTLKFRDTQIVDGDGSVNATKINGVLSTDIFESDKKTVKESTLAQNVADGSITKSALNKPQQLVSHSIYIKASDYSMEVAIPCVNNSSSYGNNFLNFCNDYKSGSVAYAENLTAGGHLNRETDGGLFVNITQAMKMEKISAGQVFKYKIDFAGVRYNSEKNRMEGSTLSLYIRNGDDGTKAYKYIEPTSGEPVYTIRDLAYSITGIENI